MRRFSSIAFNESAKGRGPEFYSRSVAMGDVEDEEPWELVSRLDKSKFFEDGFTSINW